MSGRSHPSLPCDQDCLICGDVVDGSFENSVCGAIFAASTKINDMSQTQHCIKCQSSVTYFDGSLFHCTECFHEWTQEDMDAAAHAEKVLDSNGYELFDGDDVTVIKDLKVKGSSMVVKRGTRARGIRLSNEDPTHVQAKVDGQTIFLKTEFLKK